MARVFPVSFCYFCLEAGSGTCQFVAHQKSDIGRVSHLRLRAAPNRAGQGGPRQVPGGGIVEAQESLAPSRTDREAIKCGQETRHEKNSELLPSFSRVCFAGSGTGS